MKTKIVIVGNDTKHGQWLESFFGRQPDYEVQGVSHHPSWNVRNIVDYAEILFFVLEYTTGFTPDVIEYFAKYHPSPEKTWVDVGPTSLPRTEMKSMPPVEFVSIRFECPESVDVNLDGEPVCVHVKQIEAMTPKLMSLVELFTNKAKARIDIHMLTP